MLPRPRRASPSLAVCARALVTILLVAVPLAADVNRIVLRVNDQIATLFEFEQRRQARVGEIQRADLPPDRRQRLLAEVGEQTLREMYEELLVLSRANQLDVRVSDRDVDRAVEDAKASFNIQSDEAFRQALAGSGLTLDEFRQQMRKNLLIREVMGREVQQKVQLEEEDLRRYYRAHPEEFSEPRRLRVREVVVPGGPRAAEVAARVRDLLAADDQDELSALAESGEAGGLVQLGWVEQGDLESALEAAIWELDAGDVSEPVAARGGLHVVEVLEVQAARLLEFGEVEERIQRKLRAERFQSEMSSFFERLERTSYIVAQPPPEAAGFRAATTAQPPEELMSPPPAEQPEEPPAAAPDGDSGSR